MSGGDINGVFVDSDNPYKILGLQDNADLNEVKHQFRVLSMFKHPDKGGDEELYKKIVDAYNRICKGYRVKHRKERAELKRKKSEEPKMTEKDTRVEVVITLEEGFNGCIRTITYDNGDSVTVTIPPKICIGDVVCYEGMGKKVGGSRVNMFLSVKFALDKNFSFKKHYGKYVLVYYYYMRKNDIRDIMYIKVNGVGRYIKTPMRVRNGMYLRIPSFGYFFKGVREDLYVRICLK